MTSASIQTAAFPLLLNSNKMAVADAFANLPELFRRRGTSINPTKYEHNVSHEPRPTGVEAMTPKPRKDRYVLLLIDVNSHTVPDSRARDQDCPY